LHAAAEWPKRRTPQVSDIRAIEYDPTGRRLLQPHDRQGRGRLPATTLADETKRFTPAQIEGYAINRLDRRNLTLAEHPLRNWKGDPQILDAQEYVAR
jgi:hypothetical protein